jgi:RNA polymerase sigma-70 factor, ECF subfamily
LAQTFISNQPAAGHDWHEIHHRAHRQLRATAARIVSWDDAEDLVQEAFLKALQSERGFRSESALTTWVHSILVNTCIDVQRRRRRRGLHVTLDSIDVGQSRSFADECAIRQAWRTLTARHRAVCYLHDVAGFTHTEIAERLGMCVGSSKSALFNARRKLRSRLAGGTRARPAVTLPRRTTRARTSK